MRLILLLIAFLLSQEIMNSLGSPTKIQSNNSIESVLCTLNYGVCLEPTNQVATYNGYLYLPIIHHIPPLNHSLKSAIDCNKSWVDQDLIASYQKYLDDLLPTVDKLNLMIGQYGNREKRSINDVAGVLSGGLAIWNRISISTIQSKIRKINQYLNEGRENSQVIFNQTNLLTKKMNEVIVTINDIYHAISDRVKEITCELHETRMIMHALTTIAITVPASFIRAVEWSLQGKVSPDLVPSTQLIKLLEKQVGFQESVYYNTPSLVYELGTFVVHRITRDPSLITGVIILPNIIEETQSLLYTTGTVPAATQERSLFQITLPTQVVLDRENNWAWQVDPLECQQSSRLLICPTSIAYRSRNYCVQNLLFKGLIDSCTLTPINSSNESNGVIQFQSGVLLGTGLAEWKVIALRNGRSLITKSGTNQSDPIFISSDAGDHVVVGEKVFSLILSVLEVNQEEVKAGWTDTLIPQLKPTMVNISDSDLTHIELKHKVELEKGQSPVIIYSALVITFIGLVTLCALQFWYIWTRITRNKKRVISLGEAMGYTPAEYLSVEKSQDTQDP